MEIRIKKNFTLGEQVFVKDAVVDMDTVPLKDRDEVMKYAMPVWETNSSKPSKPSETR